MRDLRQPRHDQRQADPSILGVHFPCSRPCSSGMSLPEQTDREERPLRWQGSGSRCKWTVVGRRKTTNEEVSAQRPVWSGRSSSRSEAWRQGPSIPRRQWSCVRSSPVSRFSIKVCISLPLRRSSICGHLRFGSVEPDHLRPDGRQGAYPALQCGHEKGPAGHQAAAFSGLSDAFFGLAAKGDFGVAPDAVHPCVGQDHRWIDRRVMDEARGST